RHCTGPVREGETSRASASYREAEDGAEGARGIGVPGQPHPHPELDCRVAVAGTQALLRARGRTPVTVHQLDLEGGERLAHPLRAAEVRRVRVDAERPGQGQDPERARDVHRDDRAVDDALVIEV